MERLWLAAGRRRQRGRAHGPNLRFDPHNPPFFHNTFSDLEKDGDADAAGPPPPSTDDPENAPPPAAFSGGADAAAAVVCHHAAILRSKRLLLTYLSERIERIKALRWRHAALPARVRDGLSPSEAAFFTDYDRLLAATTGPAGLACDVTLAERPPAAAGDVMVRCVASGGDVAFSTGTFRLDAGTVHTLPRAEAEPLLREGILVEVTDGAREQQEI